MQDSPEPFPPLATPGSGPPQEAAPRPLARLCPPSLILDPAIVNSTQLLERLVLQFVTRASLEHFPLLAILEFGRNQEVVLELLARDCPPLPILDLAIA